MSKKWKGEGLVVQQWEIRDVRTHQPNPVNWVPNVTSQLPKVEHRVPAQKDAPNFEVANPRIPNDKQRNQVLQYKYVMGIMNGINQESVFQKLLSQPVTMKLEEILGSSFKLGHWLQTATKSQQFPIQQVRMSNISVLREVVSNGMVDSDIGVIPWGSSIVHCTVAWAACCMLTIRGGQHYYCKNYHLLRFHCIWVCPPPELPENYTYLSFPTLTGLQFLFCEPRG